MNSESGVICAYVLDGEGGGREISEDEIGEGRARDGLFWVHLDHAAPMTRHWLREQSGIDPVIVEALLAEDARPRCLTTKSGMLVILRGVNLNPGADPEDMVSIRMWLEGDRVITVRRRRVMAVEDLRESLVEGVGPATTGSFLVHLSDRLVTRMGGVVSDLDDGADELEDEVLTAESYELRSRLATLRRAAISIRRYLAPQRDVMTRLQGEPIGWMDDLDRGRIREIADRTLRFVEDLDSIRDRAAVTQEELNSRLAEQMNRTMYALSVVAGIFLPLGLITGLLGINVGGMPGVDSPVAFTLVCALLVVVGMVQLWFFRRKNWL